MARKPRSEPRAGGRPGSPRARLFLALDLPADVRAALVGWRERALRGRDEVRGVAPEALHVTLVFLGYRPEKEVPAIAAAAFEPLRALPAPLLAPAGIAGVGPRRAPRLFALDLDDAEQRCAKLQAAAAGALEAAGFQRPEKRPFWPHVTVARVKRGARAEPLEGVPALEPFVAGEVTLYRSHLGPRGARYEPLERLALVTRP